jgi:hypothetical protein
MRKIKIETWKAKVPVRDEKGQIIGTEDQDENLLSAFNVLVANKKPEDMPRGLDKFRTFSRLVKAFDKAEKSKVLELEEVDYMFLKKEIELNIPSVWGMNKNLMESVEAFLEAKEENK